MTKKGYAVLDSDLHVYEPEDLYLRYLDERYAARAPRVEQRPNIGGTVARAWVVDDLVFPRPIGRGRADADTSARERMAPYAARNFDNVSQLEAMDVEGIDLAVLFRTLPVNCADSYEPEFAAALCRAWNDWITDFRQADPLRMGAACLLSLHDPELAAAELRRCVEELGMVAAQMMPNPVNGRHLNDPSCDVLWAEAQRLNVPICFHPAPNNYAEAHFVNRYLTMPSTTLAGSLNNPVELMGAIGAMTAGGVLDRFPNLRVAFLEGNCSWLPWLLWRLDEFWEMCHSGESVKLNALPSEYFLRQCFISVEPEEHYVDWVIEKLGDDILVFSTDYPHSDSRFPEATNGLLELPISDSSKHKILWDNCARLYGVPEHPPVGVA
ncbi:MAG TPA: amidohydrolase family protein [Dehalococcoidia bacterium]|nr:amidohydrolase family protein [Dehalococcoidia bacterium]